MSVALGNDAAVLFTRDPVEGLGKLADTSNNAIGRSIEQRSLPERVRLPSTRMTKEAA